MYFYKLSSMAIQFISSVEKVEKIVDTVYVHIKGLDLSPLRNRPYDPTLVRRVKVKRKEQESFKKFIILDVEDTEFKIQVSNQVFLKI